MKNMNKIIWYTVSIVVITLVALLSGCNCLISRNADGRLYNEINAVPQAKVGLLLGTTPQTRIGRRANQFFKYRIDATVRATKVYGINSYIVISQKFHNERALYLAEHLGMDVHNLTDFNAADATSNMAIITYVREYLARVKVFIDIITNKQPRSMDKSGIVY